MKNKQEEILVRYKLELGGTDKDKAKVIETIKNKFPEIRIYELIEPGVWSLEKTPELTEADIDNIAEQIISVTPDVCFILNILHYYPATHAKIQKYNLFYYQHKLKVSRDG